MGATPNERAKSTPTLDSSQDINPNEIFESGGSYPTSNIISQSQNDFPTEDQEMHNDYTMPKALDLNTSGLRRSSRIAELKKRGTNPNYAPSQKKYNLAYLTIFGLFCSAVSTIG